MSLGRVSAVIAAVALFGAACGGSGSGDVSTVDAAEARVTSSQKAVNTAQTKFDDSKSTFCANTKTYITAVDRYGKAFEKTAATVGDMKAAGADLVKPREAVQSSAQTVVDARDALAKEKQDLAEAEAALAAAKASESGSSTTAPRSTTTSTTAPLLPAPTVDRVKKAEDDLAAASGKITDQTPLAQATAQYNAAAFALEAAWLRVFADAGCLSDEQQAKAEAALHDYTVALQTALQTAGVYTGEIDGIYGPSTVDAVEKLQTANGLPATGFVDQATAAVVSGAVLAKGGAVASQAVASTAAVQSTLKLAGYWTGAVDGQWTPELTAALQKFQTALGVPATGAVDAATLGALEETIAQAKTSSSTTTTAKSSSQSTTSTTGG